MIQTCDCGVDIQMDFVDALDEIVTCYKCGQHYEGVLVCEGEVNEHVWLSPISKEKEMANYGCELILDLHECNPQYFTRERINEYFTELCKAIDMQKCEVHFWDDVGVPLEFQQTNPKTKGTSAVCFILTSTITIHTLDELQTCYVNIFSCKEFDSKIATEITRHTFFGIIVSSSFIVRI